MVLSIIPLFVAVDAPGVLPISWLQAAQFFSIWKYTVAGRFMPVLSSV